MSNDQKAISLDFYQWGAVLSADLARYRNFVENYTNMPERYGPVDAEVVAELHGHLDNTKRMVVAWAAACQKLNARFETATDSSSKTNGSLTPPQQQPSFASKNGAVELPLPKRRGRPPKNEDKRVRLAPRS